MKDASITEEVQKPQILITQVDESANESGLRASVIPQRKLTQVKKSKQADSVLLTSFAQQQLSKELFGRYLYASASSKARVIKS